MERVMLIAIKARLTGIVDGDILGQVDEHRTGSARAGDPECLGYDIGKVFNPAHQETVLYDWHRYTEHIDFLESIRADEMRCHLTGYGHHGHRIHVSVGDAGDQIGGARS